MIFRTSQKLLSNFFIELMPCALREQLPFAFLNEWGRLKRIFKYYAMRDDDNVSQLNDALYFFSGLHKIGIQFVNIFLWIIYPKSAKIRKEALESYSNHGLMNTVHVLQLFLLYLYIISFWKKCYSSSIGFSLVSYAYKKKLLTWNENK